MKETLKFEFTAADPAKYAKGDNPHAKASTNVDATIDALEAEFGDAVQGRETFAGEDTVFVAKARILDVVQHLKAALGYTYLSDLGGLDRFTEEERFEVFYNLINMAEGKRLRVKVRIDEEDLTVPSITSVHRSANWNERETYDMMGIEFEGHNDLRRMYLPEDFEYFPQRKEFPLLGVPGSLPLPPRRPEDGLTMDPYAAAHDGPTPKSYQEPASPAYADDDH
ncbi:MAG: NADH-quinone oxidoreductase subunit C [Rhodothermales bacterium]